MKKFGLLIILFTNLSFAQPWNYNFGTGTGTFTSSTASTTFLPTPISGTARVRVGTNPGSIVMANPGLASLGTDTELQITSNTGSTSTTKFSVYDYTSGKTGYVKFKIAFSGGTNGVYKFSLGDGANYSDNNAMSAAQIFIGIEWTLGASNTISYKVLNGTNYGTTGISDPTTLFTQSTSTVYQVEVYANNTTSSTNYDRTGTSYNLANATWDLWVDGVRVGAGLAKGGLGTDAVFDSYAFNHQTSATVPGTFYLDDLEYSNALPTAVGTPTLLVNLTSLSGLNYVFGSGPSVSQSYNLSGSSLTGFPGNITIMGSTNYEVSTDNSSFSGSVNVPFTNATLSSTSIYVRLKSGLSVGSYNGEIISNTGGGATTQNVACNGSVIPPLPNAWINELHYDNASTDVNEFVEIVIPVAYNTPVELAKFEVVLYNGSGGVIYNTKSLTDYNEGATEDGITYYYFNYTSDGGIQNGSPDGLALGYNGTLLQFLSYEGAFSATAGIANGVTSIDIGVSEDGTQTGMSLGLRTDIPNTWDLLIAQTPGQINAIAFPVELTAFSATTIGSTIKLSWNTATEINNYGFEVERKTKDEKSKTWEKIGFVNGNGNSNSPKDYSFVDDKVSAGKYSYRLKQIDNDGQFEYSKTIEVDMNGVKKFELSQNYPNPFNPTTTIKFNLPEAGTVKLTLFNILGQELRSLVNGFKESGTHTINFDASELNSGMYIYKIESGSFTQTRKMTLVK